MVLVQMALSFGLSHLLQDGVLAAVVLEMITVLIIHLYG